FAGDTRLHDELTAIAERYRPTVALLPVDGTRLRGGGMHVMTPDDAALAARTLKCSLVLPTHAEARFTDPVVKYGLATTVAEAPARFAAVMARGLPKVRCAVPLAGERVALGQPG